MQQQEATSFNIKVPKKDFLIILLLMLVGLFALIQSRGNIGTLAQATQTASQSPNTTMEPTFYCLGMGTCSCPTTNFQCSDKRDNDNDGASDFGFDFACTSCNDNSESDVQAQCQDGTDNDSDGKKDFPDDPGCTSLQDNTESDSEADKCRTSNDCGRANQICDTDGVCKDAVLCGNNPPKYCKPNETCVNDVCKPAPDTTSCKGLIISDLKPLKLDKTYVVPGETITATITYKNPCTVDFSVQTIKIEARDAKASTVDFSPDLGAQTVAAGKEIPVQATLTIRGDEKPGLWHAFSRFRDSAGNWPLDQDNTLVPFTVTIASTVGQACGSTQPCSFGLLCTNSVCTQSPPPLCTPRQCADEVDNDNDGKNNYPDDPGCTDLLDDNETDGAAAPPPANPPPAAACAAANAACTPEGGCCDAAPMACTNGICQAPPQNAPPAAPPPATPPNTFLHFYKPLTDNDGNKGISRTDIDSNHAVQYKKSSDERRRFVQWLNRNFENIDGHGPFGKKSGVITWAELSDFIMRVTGSVDPCPCDPLFLDAPVPAPAEPDF